MPTDPVEAEATGQQLTEAEFAGRSWAIPLDVDDWPQHVVLDSVAIDDNKKLVVNKPVLSLALQLLLGDQWEAFIDAAPTARKLVDASQAFATAVGFKPETGQPLDIAFGAVPRLLFTLRDYPGPVEATLAQLGFDYRDRFRYNAGRRRLTLRQIHVHLSHAPYDCPLNIARNGGKRPLSDAAIAVFDLYEQIVGKTHPTRLATFATAEADQRKTTEQKNAQAVADYKKRHAASTPAGRRQGALATARANARKLGRHAHAEED